MRLVSILLIAVLIALKEVPGMVRKKRLKELFIFGGILGLGTVYALNLAFRWNLPSPTDLMDAIFRPVTVRLEQWLS